MIVLALCEASTLYGLILYFMGGGLKDFYILMAYSLTLFVLFFPRFSQWEEYTAGVQS